MAVEYHREEMVRLLPSYKAEKEKIENHVEALHNEKRVYRNQFKHAEISQKEYQEHLKKISQKRFSLKENLRKQYEKLFGKFLPDLPYGMEEQVISLLISYFREYSM